MVNITPAVRFEKQYNTINATKVKCCVNACLSDFALSKLKSIKDKEMKQSEHKSSPENQNGK